MANFGSLLKYFNPKILYKNIVNILSIFNHYEQQITHVRSLCVIYQKKVGIEGEGEYFGFALNMIECEIY